MRAYCEISVHTDVLNHFSILSCLLAMNLNPVVDLPNTMVDLPHAMVGLPNTMLDLPNTMVDLPNTMVDIPKTPWYTESTESSVSSCFFLFLSVSSSIFNILVFFSVSTCFFLFLPIYSVFPACSSFVYEFYTWSLALIALALFLVILTLYTMSLTHTMDPILLMQK